MSGTSAGQAFLAMLESDLITAGGTPLMAFLQACQAAQGNVLLEQSALLQFMAAAPGAGLTFLNEVQGQLLSTAITKLQAEINKQNAAKAVPAPGAGTTS